MQSSMRREEYRAGEFENENELKLKGKRRERKGGGEGEASPCHEGQTSDKRVALDLSQQQNEKPEPQSQ